MRLLDTFAEPLAYASLLTNERTAAEADYATVKQDMDNLLHKAKNAADTDSNSLEAAAFAICAWIDEQLLNSQWKDRDQWLSQPLQKRHYHTLQAGEKFYSSLQDLLHTEQGSGEPEDAQDGRPPASYTESGRTQALEVFAACLALGFTGRYYRPEDRETREELKHTCLNTIYSAAGDQGTGNLFPEAYPRKASRHRWRGVTSPGLIAAFGLPIAVLIAMYVVYDGMLADMLHNLVSAY